MPNRELFTHRSRQPGRPRRGLRAPFRAAVWVFCCLALGGLLLVLARPGAAADPGESGPYPVASLTVTVTNPDTESELEVDIYYPSDGGGVDPEGAPYPGLVFAHGFLGFRSAHAGNGEHLASWGYVVAIPDFPDEDLEVRTPDVQYLLTYLENENTDPGSPFYQRIDPGRFGVVGHSLGGLTSLMVAARDGRVRAVVGLDPAGAMEGMGDNTWDYETEAPRISAPLIVIGAPSQACNANAGYEDIFPYVGSVHKAKYVLADASHCDFLSPSDPLQSAACSLLCGAYSEDRMQLGRQYTAAWFNYYLQADTSAYTYLYGDEAAADLAAGRVETRAVQTAMRGASAGVQAGAIELNWTLWSRPPVAGINVYRRQEGGDYPRTPLAQLGLVSSYEDRAVVPGQRYFYVLRSRDAAGNEHQPSTEVSAVIPAQPTLTPTATTPAQPTLIPTTTPGLDLRLYLPLIIR